MSGLLYICSERGFSPGYCMFAAKVASVWVIVCLQWKRPRSRLYPREEGWRSLGDADSVWAPLQNAMAAQLSLPADGARQCRDDGGRTGEPDSADVTWTAHYAGQFSVCQQKVRWLRVCVCVCVCVCFFKIESLSRVINNWNKNGICPFPREGYSTMHLEWSDLQVILWEGFFGSLIVAGLKPVVACDS